MSARVVVCGAGVMGVAAARSLAARAHRVTLCDPGPLPHPLAASSDISKVVVIVSLDRDNTVESEVHLDLTKLGLAPDAPLRVRDELTGATFTWGARNFVRLTPANPAHILVVV